MRAALYVSSRRRPCRRPAAEGPCWFEHGRRRPSNTGWCERRTRTNTRAWRHETAGVFASLNAKGQNRARASLTPGARAGEKCGRSAVRASTRLEQDMMRSCAYLVHWRTRCASVARKSEEIQTPFQDTERSASAALGRPHSACAQQGALAARLERARCAMAPPRPHMGAVPATRP